MKFSLGAIAVAALGLTGFLAGDSSLKNHFKNAFLIGAALNASEIEERNPAETSLILAQFNSITPENVMKCEVIQPGWNEYHFDLADKYVAFGLKHQMFIGGHTLIWHSHCFPL